MRGRGEVGRRREGRGKRERRETKTDGRYHPHRLDSADTKRLEVS